MHGYMKLSRILPLFVGLLGLAAWPAFSQSHAAPRILVLIVCDGLRPDFVTQRDMPHLYQLAREGVRFDRNHAQYPTVTMVNAATLASGAPPGTSGILGDAMFLGPALAAHGANLDSDALKPFAQGPVDLENSATLAAANSSDGFAGNLIGLDTVVQEVEREGGFIAVVGKRGPTFLFDPRVNTVSDGRDSLHEPHVSYMFLADDAAYPATLEDTQKLLPPRSREGVWDRERDAAFARFVADRAIPAARQAIDSSHPAMVTLWLHNPDVTQHRAGLGTLAALGALSSADENIATIQAA